MHVTSHGRILEEVLDTNEGLLYIIAPCFRVLQEHVLHIMKDRVSGPSSDMANRCPSLHTFQNFLVFFKG